MKRNSLPWVIQFINILYIVKCKNAFKNMIQENNSKIGNLLQTNTDNNKKFIKLTQKRLEIIKEISYNPCKKFT